MYMCSHASGEYHLAVCIPTDSYIAVVTSYDKN